MLVKSNFSQQRIEKLYQKEVALILYQIIQTEHLPSFSLSYCVLSGRGESLRVYLNFFQAENSGQLLELIQKKYSPLIKKVLAKSKKFAYIPTLHFLVDEQLELIQTLEKIKEKLIK